MAEVKFRFETQQYQTDAVESVVRCFEGQPRQDPAQSNFMIDPKQQKTHLLPSIGYGNAPLEISDETLFANICNVQERQGLFLSNSENRKRPWSAGAEKCRLDVEMETGTGKTYVYIKTIFALHKAYGWTKFIIVVPSIAIREGVKKSFEMTADHFLQDQAIGLKIQPFVYDSSQIGKIREFCTNNQLSVMIINTQAFNARGQDARRIRVEQDDFESQAPMEVIQQCRPILILDEPQKMEGKATQVSLQDFNPLFILNYSATHKTKHDLIYSLDALDAYRERLVKQIEVKGFDVRNLSGTGGYLYLSEIRLSPSKPPEARVEFERKTADGIRRITKLVKFGDDLFAHSNGLAEYAGYTVNNIDANSGNVEFTNGEVVHVGEIVNDQLEKTLRRAQIRETIRSHFEKEKKLFHLGIKVLSLFFIDEVRNYRVYDDEGKEETGLYGRIFEEEYEKISQEYRDLTDEEYTSYLDGISPAETHTGYFSIDKKTGRMIDSVEKKAKKSDEEGVCDDVSAFDLIMRNKERLLSFDEPVRFIFSHSALGEGWDNPNVFQICALKPDGNSPTRKRQEVGRGMRICVNQHGERAEKDSEALQGRDFHDVNLLTVVASGGYGAFADDLQKGISEALRKRPEFATVDYFKGKKIATNDGSKSTTITERQANVIISYLLKNDYIDEDGKVAQDFYQADDDGDGLVTFAAMPDSIKEISNAVFDLVRKLNDPNAVDDMVTDGREAAYHENPIRDERFKRAEFQELWNKISPKYAYEVEFDTEELIKAADKRFKEPGAFNVTRLAYTRTSGVLNADVSRDQLKSKEGFEVQTKKTEQLNVAPDTSVAYDLVGEIARGARIKRRTAAQILKNMPPLLFGLFKENPEEFIRKVSEIINEVRASIFVQSISYRRLDGKDRGSDGEEIRYDAEIFTQDRATLSRRGKPTKKCIQDLVFPDGYAKDGNSIESRFVDDLESAEEVAVYAKLPKSFQIPTPVGNYSPDWAIAFNKGAFRHVFFVAETKGSMKSMDLRPVEQSKIECAKKLFKKICAETRDGERKIIYHTVDSYQTLTDILREVDDGKFDPYGETERSPAPGELC